MDRLYTKAQVKYNFEFNFIHSCIEQNSKYKKSITQYSDNIATSNNNIKFDLEKQYWAKTKKDKFKKS